MCQYQISEKQILWGQQLPSISKKGSRVFWWTLNKNHAPSPGMPCSLSWATVLYLEFPSPPFHLANIFSSRSQPDVCFPMSSSFIFQDTCGPFLSVPRAPYTLPHQSNDPSSLHILGQLPESSLCYNFSTLHPKTEILEACNKNPWNKSISFDGWGWLEKHWWIRLFGRMDLHGES